jgi:hypothetical protein
MKAVPIVAIVFGVLFILSGLDISTVRHSSHAAVIAIIQILIGVALIAPAALALHNRRALSTPSTSPAATNMRARDGGVRQELVAGMNRERPREDQKMDRSSDADIMELEKLINHHGIHQVLRWISSLCVIKWHAVLTQDDALATRWNDLSGAINEIIPKAKGL